MKLAFYILLPNEWTRSKLESVPKLYFKEELEEVILFDMESELREYYSEEDLEGHKIFQVEFNNKKDLKNAIMAAYNKDLNWNQFGIEVLNEIAVQ